MTKISIAVLVDADGNPASFSTMAGYSLFSRTDEAWEKRDVAGKLLEGCSRLSTVRERMRAFIASLADCRTIVGSSISGVQYNLLDQSGFRIFEAGALSPALLDEIARERKEGAAKEDEGRAASPVPEEAGEPGLYVFDLVAAMAAHSDLTSKEALLPFFSRTPFVELRLRCNHKPPWFDRYFPEHGLAYTESAQEEGVLVVIRRAVCAAQARGGP